MPIRRIHPFRRKSGRADQKPEQQDSLWRKIAPHLPAVWLFGALLWYGFIRERLSPWSQDWILAFSIYFGLTSLVGFFIRCLAPPRVRDIPDLVLIVVTVLMIFFPGGEFFDWTWLVPSLLLAAMTLEDVVRAFRCDQRRRAVWKAVFAAMALFSLYFIHRIGAAWASC